MYIFGGYGNGMLTDVWAFDIGTNKWENLITTTSTIPAIFRTSVRYKSQALIFGGQNSEFSHPTKIYSYDIRNNTFSVVWSDESAEGINYFFSGSHSLISNDDLAIILFGTYPGGKYFPFQNSFI